MEGDNLKLIKTKDKDSFIVKFYEGFNYEVNVYIWKPDNSVDPDIDQHFIIKPAGNIIFQPDVTYNEEQGGLISFRNVIDITPNDWEKFINSAEDAINLCEELKNNKDLTKLEE